MSPPGSPDPRSCSPSGARTSSTAPRSSGLIASLSRLLDPAAAASAMAPADLEVTDSRPVGGTHLLDALWRKLGIDTAMRNLLAGRKLDPRVERILVRAGRQPGPGRLLQTRRDRLDRRRRPHRRPRSDQRRGLLPGDGLAHRDRPDLAEQVYFQVTDLLNLEVDLLFFDATTDVLRNRPSRRARRTRPRRAGRRRARRGRQAHRVPLLRQVEGRTRRPAASRGRDGGHPRRNPGAGVVLARRHRREQTDSPGQRRHAGLVPLTDRVGGRPRVLRRDNRGN